MSHLRTRLIALTSAAAAVLSLTGITTADAETAASATPVSAAGHAGLTRLLTEGTPSGRAIATFDAVPTPGQVSALRDLGLTVQPMHRLPLALVSGPVADLRAAVTGGIARDVYPDERIQLLDTASTDAMSSSPSAARALRAKGFTGKGVTVAVVDSGCDATHPDLADHVKHNVSLFSPEYANQAPDSDTTLVVAEDKGPYSNSDIGGGHGTHVAGIVAADSSSVQDRSRYGVAPDATLDCFAIGEVLFTTAVVTAYDYMLDQPRLWGIDVVNNSWGNSYRQFDPRDPVAVATRAVVARGVTVVFAAGNSGSGDVPMSLNPFSQSPWVISVAAGTLNRHRSDFSSNGLINDNSAPSAIDADGHTTYVGDRIGLVHPDITAPGDEISSTCDTLGTVVGPCPPGENTTASGTSMASPHIAGAAAVLKQAQPRLTPNQVRLALQATATRVLGDNRAALPFWQVGYGYANLDRAVKLVRSAGWRDNLRAAARKADGRVRRADGVDVRRADFWVYAAPPATFQGSDTHTFKVAVGRRTRILQLSLAYPSAGSVGVSMFSYTVKAYGPSGRLIATSTNDPVGGSGTALARVNLGRVGAGAGTYRFVVTGDYAASDPDTVDSDSALGRFVTLHVAQLRRS